MKRLARIARERETEKEKEREREKKKEFKREKEHTGLEGEGAAEWATEEAAQAIEAATLVVKDKKFEVLPGREKFKTSTEGAEERDADVKEGEEKKEEGVKVHFAGEWNCREEGGGGGDLTSSELEVTRNQLLVCDTVFGG